jgi:phosphoribosylformylglycinamidine synthase
MGGTAATVGIAGDPFVALFSESAARAIVATADSDAVLGLAGEHGVSAAVIGITGGDALVVDGAFAVGLDELREQSEGTLPALFG